MCKRKNNYGRNFTREQPRDVSYSLKCHEIHSLCYRKELSFATLQNSFEKYSTLSTSLGMNNLRTLRFHLRIKLLHSLGFPGVSDGKEFACSARDPGLIPGLGRSPGECHGQRSLAGCSPWGHKELHTTE